MSSCYSSSMKPTLPTLAIELVELIACWLGPADLCSLQLVCKNLRQKPIRLFGARFTTVRTDLSQKSLQKLQEISEDDHLRLYVEKLLIKENKPEELGQDFQWHRHSSGYLEAPIPGFEKLQYLLAHNLSNCRSFHIYDPGYGPNDKSDVFTPTDVVALILSMVPFLSIEASNSLPVKSFIVDCASPPVVVTPRRGIIDGTSFIVDCASPTKVVAARRGMIDAKRLQMWQYRQPSFREAWAHIQELVLHQFLEPKTLDWGIHLIIDATSLRKLSVIVGRSSRPFLERLSQVTSLHSLESFKLTCAHTSVEVLSRLIERFHDTLRVLSLSNIYLQRLTDWLIILGRLGNQAPFLHSVSISGLTTSSSEVNQVIMFPSLVIDPVVPESGGRKLTLIKDRTWQKIFGVEYQGPRVDKALDKLVKAVEYFQTRTT